MHASLMEGSVPDLLLTGIDMHSFADVCAEATLMVN
jgi:hypothetical protein